jgi:glycine/D-amino acid oxidase-like deaminating enzyme
VRFADQGEFHPVKFLHGLALGLEASGARIYEGTFADAVDAGSPCRVRTDGGHTVTVPGCAEISVPDPCSRARASPVQNVRA